MDMITPPRPMYEVKARDRWIVSVDLRQSHDYTAICAIHHTVVPLPTNWKLINGALRQQKIERFDVLHLERLRLGMPYPEQVEHVKRLLDRDPLRGAKLVLDETGVGRPVADIFNAAGLNPTRVAIGSGSGVSRRGANSYTVPKGHLISGLVAKMHCGEFKIAPSISAPLLEELKDFQRKVSESGRTQYDARSGAFDDLILSCAIGLWLAMNDSGATCEPPFEPDPAGWYRAQRQEPPGYRQ
jgi:hypothetical protein